MCQSRIKNIECFQIFKQRIQVWILQVESLRKIILQIFISFNGLDDDQECTKAICNSISRSHPELIHLDLSHYKFTEEKFKLILTDLAFNSIIYGFHFEGNVGFNVNTRGFLIKDAEQKLVLIEDQSKLLIEEIKK